MEYFDLKLKEVKTDTSGNQGSPDRGEEGKNGLEHGENFWIIGPLLQRNITFYHFTTLILFTINFFLKKKNQNNKSLIIWHRLIKSVRELSGHPVGELKTEDVSSVCTINTESLPSWDWARVTNVTAIL